MCEETGFAVGTRHRKSAFLPSDALLSYQYGLDIISTALLGENGRKSHDLSCFLSPSTFDQALSNTSKEVD